jgi:hypothetical protein
MTHRLATPEGKKLYGLRKQTPEPVFGIIKSVLGFFPAARDRQGPRRMEPRHTGLEHQAHVRPESRRRPACAPAILADIKERELVGDIKNAGREYRPKGQPEPARVHDFKLQELARAATYGVYDIAGNTG